MYFFKRHFQATRNTPLVMMAYQLGFFLFGIVLVVVVNTFFNSDQDYAPLGSLMAIIGVFAGLVARGGGAAARFRMAVSMGQTRRDFLLIDPLLTVLTSLLGVGVAWCLTQAETWLYSLLYPGYENELDLTVIFQWKYIPLILGVALLDLFLGAVHTRFGFKGFAVLWFPLCFAPAVIGQALRAAQSSSGSLLAGIGRGLLALAGLEMTAWLAIGAAVVLAMLTFIGFSYNRAEIRL